MQARAATLPVQPLDMDLSITQSLQHQSPARDDMGFRSTLSNTFQQIPNSFYPT